MRGLCRRVDGSDLSAQRCRAGLGATKVPANVGNGRSYEPGSDVLGEPRHVGIGGRHANQRRDWRCFRTTTIRAGFVTHRR